MEAKHFDGRRKSSYKDTVLGMNQDIQMEERNSMADGDVSDVDITEEQENGPWFSMGMPKDEKLENLGTRV